MSWKRKLHRAAVFALAAFTIGVVLAWLTPGPSSFGAERTRNMLYIGQASPAIQRGFTCVIMHESHSTWARINMGDNRPEGESSGVFQMSDGPGTVWWKYAPMVHVYVRLQHATYRQQNKVAMEVYRFDGWQPWRGDGCF